MFKPNSIHTFVNIDSEFLHNYFREKKHDYKVMLTGKSTMFADMIDKESYIISDNQIRFGLMRLIKMTKDNVKKNIETGKAKVLEVENKNFFEVNKKEFTGIEGTFDNVNEIDLTHAYLETAKRLNFIDDKVYKRLSEITGQSRKICLGSLATKKTIKYYDEKGNLINQEVVQDDILKQAWFNIVSSTDSIMQNILYLNNFQFYFYWVDNFFTSVDSPEIKIPENIPVKFLENKSLNYTINSNGRLWLRLSDSREFNLRI